MKRSILIPINHEEPEKAGQTTYTIKVHTHREFDNLSDLQRLGITIDEVRMLLSEWVSRNLGMHDMASKVKFCIENTMPVAHKSGHISITELAIFRKEVKLDNGLPEEIL